MHASVAARGRLVLTHSTHVEGLVAVLRLLSGSPLVQTIVPGRLASGRGAAAGLHLRLGVATPSGYKMLARKGSQVQEVFLTINGGAAAVPPARLREELARLLPAGVVLALVAAPAAAPPPQQQPESDAEG